jgi:hypothetical protein
VNPVYGQTWIEIGTTPTNVAWQMLRALRHAPPGLAANGDRKATFGSALEQAEQLFIAAKDVSPAASPLLVFYGLSQAGRAVAAAAVNVGGNDWKLSGHGITNGPTAGITASTLPDLTVKDKDRGAFTRLASILDAASLPTATRLGDIWCLIPEAGRFPLAGMGDAEPLIVEAESPHIVRAQNVRARVYPVPGRLAYQPTPGGSSSPGQAAERNAERIRVAAFLNQYPLLSGWEFVTPAGERIFQYVGPDQGRIQIKWDKPDDATSEEDELAKRTVGYRNVRYSFPDIGGAGKPSHPFLLWWATLYVLSKLARYEPNSWAGLISVNDSTVATAIEYLLSQSMTVLPELIHRTIFEVTGQR